MSAIAGFRFACRWDVQTSDQTSLSFLFKNSVTVEALYGAVKNSGTRGCRGVYSLRLRAAALALRGPPVLRRIKEIRAVTDRAYRAHSTVQFNCGWA